MLRKRKGAGILDSMEIEETKPDLRGDRMNVFILGCLYILQGIPLGLTAAIPLILQNQGATFTQQAEFSFVLYPFSLKILWAPLVDSLYFEKFGRRKTWLVSAQYLIGFFMLLLSVSIQNWLGNPELKQEPQIMLLTAIFFCMNLMAATQDIALDGWALTMLKKENKSYASTCNSVGQTAGYFLGYVLFIALESATFCNSYLRSEPQDVGFVTLPGFLFFWGIAFLLVTTLVAIFKTEKRERLDSRSTPSEAIFSSYRLLFKILCLPKVRQFALILLTVKIGFAACDGITSLKLVEHGIPKEQMAIIAVPLIPLQIILPILVAKFHQDHRKPLNLYLKVMPYRLFYNFVAAFFVYVTPFVLVGKEIPMYYYILLLVTLAIHMSISNIMFVQMMSFYAVISDTAAGGTYMTLFNTLNNLGGSWSSTAVLLLVDRFTFKSCSISGLDCSNASTLAVCDAQGGKCETYFDGYYILTVLCTIVGFLWFQWGQKSIKNIQNEPRSSWKVKQYSPL